MSKRTEKWDGLKRLERRGLVALLFFPLGFFLSVLLSDFTDRKELLLIPTIVGFLCFFYSILRYTLWRCPECGNHFFMRKWPLTTLTRGKTCVSCGTSRYVGPAV
jgi:predicted RNA-binding Zn-ribbon protein involved in translation (DUF1610 family)